MKSLDFEKLSHFFRRILVLILTGVVLFGFITSLTSLEADHAAEDKQQLQAALTRAAVSCYAAEGEYPPDLAYLQDHYGIQINTDLYAVQYEYIASNLMPDITVLELAQ